MEQQMDLARYLSVLLKGWKVIGAAGIIGAVLFGAYSMLSTPQYRATTTLFFYLSGADSTTQLLQGSTYAQNQVRSFALLAEQPVVLDPVIKELNLNETSVQLSKQVTSTVALDTVVMDVSVTDTSPTQAAAIANAIGQQMSAAISGLSPTGTTAANTATVKVSTVAPATVPQYAYSPNTKLNTAVGLVLGAAIGMAVVTVRELTNNKVTSAEVAKQFTDVPVVGDIPYSSKAAKGPVIDPDAHSAQAEAYRRLSANFGFLDYGNSMRSIVMTSCLPDEGKSTSTLNLAVALSQSLRVIVVDADLRRPSIAKLTGLNDGIGLSGVLTGRAKVEDVLQNWRHGQLQVLTAGRVPPNPAELLGSEPMRQLLSELRQQCDLVILDSAPVLPTSDAAVLGRSLGGILVVVDTKRTKRADLKRGLESLTLAGGNVVGLVLNKTTNASSTYYGQYGPQPTANPKSK